MVALHKRFADNVKRLLAEKEMSQRDLAAAMGTTPMYVNNYLSGRAANPTLSVVEKFAAGLGEDPVALMAEPAHA